MARRSRKRNGTEGRAAGRARVNAVPVRGRRAVTALAALVVPALTGWGVGVWLPRGPVTSSQALALLGVALVLGFVAGAGMRSRWAMLSAPLAFFAAFELARLSAVGPTVDGIHLGTPYGALAFLLGRGVLGVLVLVPMLLGANLGVALAWRRSGHHTGRGRPVRRAIGWSASALAGAGVLVLAFLLARPASTPAIVGADGAPLPGSVAALEPVILGGQEQWILVRGVSRDAPVLLYLAGGPGQSDLPYARVLLADLVQDFVVVSWDQRGTGKSYPALEPTATLTPDRAVSDLIELTEILRARFGEERIYLLGESWGSTLAVLAAQRRPELYHAVLGSGQMVSQRETDRRLYRDVLAHAAATGDEALTRRMQAYGEPPYDSVYAYGTVMGLYDALAGDYTPPAAYRERGRDAHLGFMGVGGSEYDLIDKVNVLRGLLDMFSVLYPQLQQVDFRRDVPRLEVPLYVFDGGHELAARRDLARVWFEQLDAPIKRLYTFEDGGHSVAFEHFQDLHRILVETVLPETYVQR